MRGTIGELWIQTHIASSFRSDTLCVYYNTLVTEKLYTGRICKFHILIDYSTMRDVYFLCLSWIRLARYGSKYISQCRSCKQFVRTYPNNLRSIQVIYGSSAYGTNDPQSEAFFVCPQLHEISDWRATTPDTHQSCACILQARKYIAI